MMALARSVDRAVEFSARWRALLAIDHALLTKLSEHGPHHATVALNGSHGLLGDFRRG
jgi:hypothetical protein